MELLAGHEPVLDAGCGRGELLDLLRERGVAGTGVDIDAGMVERSPAKGHETSSLATPTSTWSASPTGASGPSSRHR